jgi:lysophospholipase L1-like esterase
MSIRRSAIIWLIQLAFPAMGISFVLGRLGSDLKLHPLAWIMLGLSLAWSAGCLLTLCFASGRRWISAHTSQLFALYISSFLCLALLEVYCRYDVITSEARWRELHSFMEYSPELGWKLVPGKDGVGAHGWRGPERSLDKPKGCYRIVCVGASTTHGSILPWEEAWPNQLERALNADDSWTLAHGRTEVINLGVPAYGTDQELLALKKYGLAYHPDLVILHLCVKDFADVSYDHDWRMWEGVTRYKPYYTLEDGQLILKRGDAPPPLYPADRPKERTWFDPYSALALKVGRFLDNRSGESLTGKNIWPIHDAFQAEYAQSRPLLWALVREMARVTQAAGSEFLVTLSPTTMPGPDDAPPWRVASFVKEYQADAAKMDVQATNCVALYFTEGGNKRFGASGDNYHMNAAGNILIAQDTARWMKEKIPSSR